MQYQTVCQDRTVKWTLSIKLIQVQITLESANYLHFVSSKSFWKHNTNKVQYTPWAIKRANLFLSVIVKNQRIFMQFSLLFRFRNEWHTWRYKLHPSHLFNVATLPCESQNTENLTWQRDITKENCIRCIIAASKWTRVIMCLTFTYFGCYTAKHIWKKDSRHRRPAKMLDANSFWLWLQHRQCWHDHLRSCVHAGGGHFEHMLWHECSFSWFTSTFYKTVNVIWYMSHLSCS